MFIEILRAAIKRDNILYFIAAIVSISILLFDLFLGDVDSSISFEVILFILAAICVAQILEREIRFDEQNSKIDQLKEVIEKSRRPIFYSRSSVVPFTDLMKEHEELFYTGGHLYHFIHTHTRHFENWLREGKSIRLILQNPDNIGLKSVMMPCVNYNSNVYREQIRGSLEILSRISSSIPNAKFGVHLSDISPTQSVAIMDGHVGGKFMCILHHLPDGESSTAPFSIMDSNSDPEWFEVFHQRYYRYLWENSTPYIIHPADAREITREPNTSKKDE